MSFIKPFLKWPGGKFRILDRIVSNLPQGKCLVEPFVGSGSVFLNTSFESFRMYDSNPDLIGVFQTLQREGEAFIEICQEFFTGKYNTATAYYTLRSRFNTSTNVTERAALFLYLNRHAYNGLVRYNSTGLFNVPFGKYKAPYFPRSEMQAFVRKVKEVNITFAVCDFREVFMQLQLGDVVYCDPPYVPLSSTANFTAYSGTVFGFHDQEELATLACNASEKNIPVLLSNHNTPLTRKLYSAARIDYFSVQRFISCKGERRNMAPELMAIFMQI